MTHDRPELNCQWCGGTIPAAGDSCTSCGAVRPRDDLRVPGDSIQEDTRPDEISTDVSHVEDDTKRARKILQDLDAYIEEDTGHVATRRSDPTDDVIVIIGVLVIGGVLGGLAGWMLAPPFLHDLFEGAFGIESEGPEAFRRLGAFVGGLITMLIGALLATMIRR